MIKQMPLLLALLMLSRLPNISTAFINTTNTSNTNSIRHNINNNDDLPMNDDDLFIRQPVK